MQTVKIVNKIRHSNEYGLIVSVVCFMEGNCSYRGIKRGKKTYQKIKKNGKIVS